MGVWECYGGCKLVWLDTPSKETRYLHTFWPRNIGCAAIHDIRDDADNTKLGHKATLSFMDMAR